MAHREEEDQNPGTVLHVANLHPHTRERDIREEFSKYGDVLECRLILDPHTGTHIASLKLILLEESRCFAFVTMATPDLARELIRRMDGTKFDDRILKVDLVRYLLPQLHP
jgi:transformer-2 protein